MNIKIKNLLKKHDNLFQEKLKLIDFNEVVVPKKEQILAAFDKLQTNIKVVILGQDPYYVPNFANGLAFSVNKGVKIPRSLNNIFKELKNEYPDFKFVDGDLSSWAKQGVLLLNTSLTTSDVALAHKHVNWEEYTQKLIYDISKFQNIVFILLGNNAKKYEKFIEVENNLILKSSHPSPLSANKGFFNSNIFLKTNQFLETKNIQIINWNLEEV